MKENDYIETYKEGMVFYNGSKYELCVESLKRIAERQDDSEVLFRLGGCYYAVGNIDESIKMYEKSIKVDNDNYRAKYNLSIMYFEKGLKLIKEYNEKIPRREVARDAIAIQEFFEDLKSK